MTPPSTKSWLFSSASAILLSQVATVAHAQAVAAPSASAYAQASAAAASDAPITTAPRGTATPIAGWTAAADGFVAMKSGQFTSAADRFVVALDSGDLNIDQKRAVTLALSDTLVQAGEPMHAAGVLSTLSPDSYDVASRLAYALDAAGKRPEAASAYKAAATEAPTANERVRMSKGRVFALAALDRRADTLAEIAPLAGARELTAGDAVNLAYLAVKFGDDRLALRLFDQGDAAKPLSSEVALDAAYVARRLKQDEPAVRYFRQSLASAVVKPTLEAEQTRYQVRREVSDLSRKFSLTGAAFYDQNDNLTGRVPGANRGDLQVGAEAAYRPFGYNGGQTVEVFARAFETLAGRRGDPTGPQTIQGWVGARVKPFTQQNFVIEASRLVPIGKVSISDWEVRAAYSNTHGLDLRQDRASWPMTHVYADTARLIDTRETFALVDARVGRSWRVPAVKNLIAAPFLGAFATYDSLQSPKAAAGVGPGVWFRQWFRETETMAPQSYVDLSLQYRLRLGGDKRASGFFLTFSASY